MVRWPRSVSFCQTHRGEAITQGPSGGASSDGAPWTIPSGEARLNVQLPAGRHKVEIRKTGFASYTEEVQVQAGRRLALNVSLVRAPGGSVIRMTGGR